jgi:hypothetical protein
MSTNDRTEDEAARAAWACVMDGCRAALDVKGLPLDDRARLVRCLRLAAKLAGRPTIMAAEDC